MVTELEENIKNMIIELEGSIDENDDVFSKFKKIAFQLSLKRYLIALKLLYKIEDIVEKNVDNINDINELMTVYKSIVKGVDLLNQQLRFLMPSEVNEEKEKVLNEDIENVLNKISSEGSVNIKEILYFQIKDLIKNMMRVRNSMKLYDTGSIDYWKAQNSYLELSAKLLDFVKLLEKVSQDEKSDTDDLTIEDIIAMYNELKEIEESDGEV